MIIKTRNSTYTLKDMGDGGFLMTSTNKDYCGPNMITFLTPPQVGACAHMVFKDGPKCGRCLITTPIVSVKE